MPIATPTSLDALAALLPYKSVAHEQRVEFIEAPADLDFDRPFWHMAFEEIDAADRKDKLEKVSISFEELRGLVGHELPATTGMIFHIGRCGSTLVSRMVGHDTARLVLREAGPVGGLHRASGGSDLVSTFAIEQAFKDLLVAFDWFAATRDQRVIVKHSSWESFSMGRVAEVLPDAPFVFVYRNPIETVESSLDGHPGWAPRLHQSRWQLQRWVPWLDRVEQPFNAATIYASVWAAGADAALQLPPERVLLIDHAELSADPGRTLQQLERHLGLSLDGAGALGELKQYSKAKDDGTEFDPKGTHAHPHLSPATRDQVMRVVGDLPGRLAERLDSQTTTTLDTQGMH